MRAFYSSALNESGILIYGGYYENSIGQKSYNSELWEVKPE